MTKVWDVYEPLLHQLALLEPGSLYYVEAELRKYQDQGEQVDVAALAETVELIICEHAPLGHSSEIAWSLWLAIVFKCQLGEKATKALASMEDSVAALVALHAREVGVFTGYLDVSKWEKLMTKDELLGPNWLLVYEASVKNWLPSVESGDLLSEDKRYGDLRDRGVAFYDDSLDPAPAGGFDPSAPYY